MNFLNFGGNQFEAAGDTALYWPVQQMLLVADLHLEKASSFARGGQMLPPYDSLATLEKLERLIVLTGARTVICLGDNFHDHGAEGRLSGRAAEILKQLTSQIEWIWITGNHDPQIKAAWGGRSMDELVVGDITLRHEAQATFANLEISGHYHPKFRVNFNRRNVARRCFVVSDRKLIMPAFGSLAGGMDASEAAYIAQPDLWNAGSAQAVLALPSRFVHFPLAPPAKKPDAANPAVALSG
jgi:DNA ligase-associated metallophosphoesterase